MALVNAVAVICEKILREADEVATLVRVVDLFTIPHDREAAVQLAVWIQLRVTADDDHKHSLSLVLVGPNGRRDETTIAKEIIFAASTTPNLPHRILMAQGNMTIGGVVPGLYAYEVLLDGEVVTKTHFVVLMATPGEKPDVPPSDSSPIPTIQ